MMKQPGALTRQPSASFSPEPFTPKAGQSTLILTQRPSVALSLALIETKRMGIHAPQNRLMMGMGRLTGDVEMLKTA